MNTFDAISGFKMYRGKLDARKLEEGHLRRILEAALWAPSGHNSQPWEFVIVDDPELIQRIADYHIRGGLKAKKELAPRFHCTSPRRAGGLDQGKR